MLNVPGEPPVPLGVYDHPPDHDFSFIKGHNVGGSGLAVVTRKITSITNDVNRWLDDLDPLPF